MKGNALKWLLFMVSLLVLSNIIFLWRLQKTDTDFRNQKAVSDSLVKFIGKIYQHPDIICDSVLNRENLLNYIKLKGIRWPNVVWAQSMVETGYLACDKCCLETNNLFGFMLNGKCMEFNTWQECVDYYSRWQTKLLKPKEDYYHFLKRIKYASFKDYHTHLAQILLDNKLEYHPGNK